MDSEQFSLIFSVVCCCISVISAIAAAAYGFEASKASRTYKEAEAKKKREEGLRNFIDQLKRK